MSVYLGSKSELVAVLRDELREALKVEAAAHDNGDTMTAEVWAAAIVEYNEAIAELSAGI